MIDPLAILGRGLVIAPLSHTADGSSDGPLKLDLELLDRPLRRSLSNVTRLFMHAAKLALSEAQCAPTDVHVIFASAFGEICTAEALLKEAYDADCSSPARFRHSVHNTATGLLSISAKSRLPCTAIAAGWDTVAMALLEAAAQLASGVPRVLLVFAEERIPLALSTELPHGPMAAALVLARINVGVGVDTTPDTARALGQLSNLRRCNLAEPLPTVFATHPLGPAIALSQAIAQGRSATLVAGHGATPWCIDVHAREYA